MLLSAQKTVVIFLSITCSVMSINNSSIPPGWESFCCAKENSDVLKQYLSDFKPQDSVVYLTCNVSLNSRVQWRFSTLRDHLNATKNVSVFVHVQCESGSKISLPWPMKAKGVVGISINNCLMVDKYSDFWTHGIKDVKGELRVMEIRHSNWLSDSPSFNKMKGSLSSIPKDYDCGQASTLEYMVTNNVSDILDPKDFSEPRNNVHENMDAYEALDFKGINFDIHSAKSNLQPFKDVFGSSPLASSVPTTTDDLFSKLGTINLHKCHFSKLRILEESYPSLMIVNYFKFLVSTNRYPELKVLNFSRSGLRIMPQEIINFRKFFPKLQLIDLSMNNMSQIQFPILDPSSGHIAINVSYNNINSFTLNDLVALSEVENLFLDLRGNPIHCGCHMADLLLKIKLPDFFVNKLHRYNYVRDLKCATPDYLAGRSLSSLYVVGSNADLQCNEFFGQSNIRASRLWSALMCSSTPGQLCNVVM